jgi:ComF family protein
MFGGWFVEICPACGGPAAAGFCGVCAAHFARVANPCPRCGLGKPVARCPLELAAWNVDAVAAPFCYAAPLDHYVQALKYRRSRALGRAFALLIAPSLVAASRDVEALVAVPLHLKRLRERGYNQAQEIARALALELGLPALERGIARVAMTAAQTGQGARDRHAGIARAFRVDRDLAGARIAIVDDVVTTGATVNELAGELKRAGAARCVVFALARTPLASPRSGTQSPKGAATQAPNV